MPAVSSKQRLHFKVTRHRHQAGTTVYQAITPPFQAKKSRTARACFFLLGKGALKCAVAMIEIHAYVFFQEVLEMIRFLLLNKFFYTG
jgi:hypothetical protein